MRAHSTSRTDTPNRLQQWTSPLRRVEPSHKLKLPISPPYQRAKRSIGQINQQSSLVTVRSSRAAPLRTAHRSWCRRGCGTLTRKRCRLAVLQLDCRPPVLHPRIWCLIQRGGKTQHRHSRTGNEGEHKIFLLRKIPLCCLETDCCSRGSIALRV